MYATYGSPDSFQMLVGVKLIFQKVLNHCLNVKVKHHVRSKILSTVFLIKTLIKAVKQI